MRKDMRVGVWGEKWSRGFTHVRTLLLCSQRHFQSLAAQALSCGVVDARHASRMLLNEGK